MCHIDRVGLNKVYRCRYLIEPEGIRPRAAVHTRSAVGHPLQQLLAQKVRVEFGGQLV
jgi:hypothetical protein